MEIVTKKGEILGVSDRSVEAMSGFYIDRLLSTLEWTKELLTAAYSLLDTQSLAVLKNLYLDLLPDAVRTALTDVNMIHDEIMSNMEDKEGMTAISGLFTPCWEKYRARFSGVIAYKNAHDVLKGTSKLSNLEINLLKFFYTEDKSTELSKLFSDFSKSQCMEILAIIFEKPVQEIYTALDETENLVSLKFINNEYFFPPYYETTALLISVFRDGEIKDMPIGLVKKESGQTFPMESFPLPRNEIRLMSSLLARDEPVNMLLYGAPGTGKSAFAFSLAEYAGRPVYTFDMIESGNGYSDRPFQILSALKHLPKNAILIIDEADKLLKTEGYSGVVDKGWLVAFLDYSPVSAIWIVNELSKIHEAVLRRFIFSKVFNLWDRKARIGLWKSLVKNSGFSREFTETLAESFARRYKVSTGNISDSIRTVSRLYDQGAIKKVEIETTLERILGEQSRITYGRTPSVQSNFQSPYEPELTRTDQDILPLRDILADYIEKPKSERVEGVNILFWGKPGTGKTAAAKYLANEMGVSLNIKRASDLMDSMVGGTEKLIKEFFNGMSGENQVALLDEADSFFLNRGKVSNAWERLQTNELLTQMENHCGVLFCCTNALESLDPAVLRRFAWKIEFLPMDKAGVKELYKKYFPVLPEENAEWEKRIDRLTGLTPGDFGILWRRYSISGKKDLKTEIILNDLERELGFRKEEKAVIGFQ